MPSWVWVMLALFLFSSGCFALLWVAILGGKQHDQRIEDCEDMRQHPADCACEELCWPAFVQRMRDIAARQAAELDRRRP